MKNVVLSFKQAVRLNDNIVMKFSSKNLLFMSSSVTAKTDYYDTSYYYGMSEVNLGY